MGESKNAELQICYEGKEEDISREINGLSDFDWEGLLEKATFNLRLEG